LKEELLKNNNQKKNLNMRLQNFLFCLLFISGTFTACNSIAQQSPNLSIADFEKGIKQSNIQVLDVRTAGEYQSGHLKDAFLADWTNQEQFIERVQSLDKSKPVYTYCLVGGRSAAAAKWLTTKGYKVYNMDGGIAAWKKAGKPVEDAAKVKQMTVLEYQSLIPNNKTVLVDVGAAWCPPCKKMNPVIDSLKKAKNLQFQLVKINGGDQTEITKQLNIESFPTFIIYKAGKEVWRKSGIVEATELVQHLK